MKNSLTASSNFATEIVYRVLTMEKKVDKNVSTKNAGTQGKTTRILSLVPMAVLSHNVTNREYNLAC